MFILQLQSVVHEISQGQPTTVKGNATQESQLVFPLASAVQRVLFNSRGWRAGNPELHSAMAH